MQQQLIPDKETAVMALFPAGDIAGAIDRHGSYLSVGQSSQTLRKIDNVADLPAYTNDMEGSRNLFFANTAATA